MGWRKAPIRLDQAAVCKPGIMVIPGFSVCIRFGSKCGYRVMPEMIFRHFKSGIPRWFPVDQRKTAREGVGKKRGRLQH